MTDNKLARIFLLTCAILAGAFTLSAQDEYWHQRVTLFDRLPIVPGDIVFLGNSITDGGEFAELFDMENVKNRGIRSDVIGGVEKRLKQVTSGHPAKIFLLIGINDVSHGHSVAELARRYERLVKAIRRQSPDTRLYLQSVMPINNDFNRYKGLRGKENVIPAFNEEIQRIALENGCMYVDLWEALAEPATGKLKRQYTNDGLHLTGAGYKAWSAAIAPLVNEPAALSGEDSETEEELLYEQDNTLPPVFNSEK